MILELDSLSHRYGTEQAVKDVSFGLESGELVAVLGPSGCGKTTLVQAIAGHVRPTAGRVLLRGSDVTDTPPETRNIGVVFQQSTLFPHMTVGENVAYGLAASDIEPDRQEELTAEYLELVDLADRREAYPATLSGGQRRRAELARALAPQPELLVLDEPLSALDRALRDQLREEIARIQRETGLTTLFVTHDQEDAMRLADRLVVMNEGRLSGTGRPRALYQHPPNLFVASFLGRSNMLRATVVDRQPLTIGFGDRRIELPETECPGRDTQTVVCHVRPGDLSVAKAAGETTPTIPGEVVRVADTGRRYELTVALPNGETVTVECPEGPPAVGSSVGITVPEHALTLFPAP